MPLKDVEVPGLDGVSELEVLIADTGTATFIIKIKQEGRREAAILAATTISPGGVHKVRAVLDRSV